VTKKVYDSYFAFKAKYDAWAGSATYRRSRNPEGSAVGDDKADFAVTQDSRAPGNARRRAAEPEARRRMAPGEQTGSRRGGGENPRGKP